MSSIQKLKVAQQKIQEVKDEQTREFNMLINEELEANDNLESTWNFPRRSSWKSEE